MSAMTDFLENKLVDFLFRGQALGITGATAAAGTGPANLYVGLLTAAPSDSTGGTEVTGGNYARVAIPSNMTSTGWDGTAGTPGTANTVASTGTGGMIYNNGVVSFNVPSATWGVVTHFGIYDAALPGGTLLMYGSLGTSKTVNANDTVSFAAGALTVTFA